MTVILFRFLTQVPAYVAIGIWFLFQIGSAAFTQPGMGGVAFWAHVGGFVAGLGLTWWGKQAGWLAPPPRIAYEEYPGY